MGPTKPDRPKLVTPREEALSYLDGHHVVTLATQGPEGPWAAAVFYVNDGFVLYFLSAPTTRHSLNLARDPRVSGTVHEDYRDWSGIKGIQLEGRVELLHGVERLKAMAQYGRKYAFVRNSPPAEIARALAKVEWYRLTPERLFLIDNAQGFGHRDEIEVS